jgi:hypothetical protein
MSNKSLKAKKAFIQRSILEGTFLPPIGDIKEIEDIEREPIAVQKKVVNRLYEYACRGVRQTNMAFLMCDILGFSEKVLKKRKGGWLYDEIVLPFLKTGIVEGKYASEFIQMLYKTVSKESDYDKNDVSRRPPRIEILSFADTLIMYPAISLRTPTVFIKPIVQILILNWAARNLFVEMLRHEVLLRGSIGFGECFISRDPICYLGNTIIEVHTAEIIQNWGGVMFSPSASRIISEFKQPIHSVEIYRVPVKKDENSIRLFKKLFPRFKGINYVMDWTLLAELNGGNIEWVRRESENRSLDSHARELNKNTVDFYDHMHSARQHFRGIVK